MDNNFMDFSLETVNQLVLQENSLLVLLGRDAIDSQLLKKHNRFFKIYPLFRRDLILYALSLLQYLKTKNTTLKSCLETMRYTLDDYNSHSDEGFPLDYLDFFTSLGKCPISIVSKEFCTLDNFKLRLNYNSFDIISDSRLLSCFEDLFTNDFLENYDDRYDRYIYEDWGDYNDYRYGNYLSNVERTDILTRVKDALGEDFERTIFYKDYLRSYYIYTTSSTEIDAYVSKYWDNPKMIEKLLEAFRDFILFLFSTDSRCSSFKVIKNTSSSEFTYFIEFAVEYSLEDYLNVTLQDYTIFLQEAERFRNFFKDKI